MPSPPANPLALAIPFFFTFIALDLWAGLRRGRRDYRFADALANLGCGVSQQVTQVFATTALLWAYAFVYDHYRFIEFAPRSPWPWLIAFVGVDFLYYWWHRLSHEVNFLWAAHVVHHQSEDYNLAVALRQSVLTSWTAVPFYLPLALLGVPTLVYITMYIASTLYQFWIHTQVIGRLGAADRLVNTPSNHRVHHAINPRYLDKNHGGILMIWDRLFGTFALEVEPPVYGTVKPMNSFNPLWAQFDEHIKLARRSLRLRGLDRLRVWWASPAWRGRGEAPVVAPEVSPDTFVKYDPRTAKSISWYVGVQFALLLCGTTAFLTWSARLTVAWQLAIAALILASLGTWAGLLENRRWARPAELLRLGAAAALVAASCWRDARLYPVAAATAVATTLLALWLTRRPRIVATPEPATLN